jgi:pimeloyl-ACP methyl ester carboxylesterase
VADVVERAVEVPGRGSTFVREVAGPPGAPTVVLLHGLGATATLNWPGALDVLAARFRVVALDHRGHGRGIRTAVPFQLRDCADDVIALADVLGIDGLVAVGYSMGGPIALHARRRHPTRVTGLVLCATAARFVDDDGPRDSRLGELLATTLRHTPPSLRRLLAESTASYLGDEGMIPPAMLDETRRHDPAALVEADLELGRFDARPWLGELACPAASIVTERDTIVPRARQIELAHAVGAAIIPLDADHEVAVTAPGRFLPALAAACHHVAALSGHRSAG